MDGPQWVLGGTSYQGHQDAYIKCLICRTSPINQRGKQGKGSPGRLVVGLKYGFNPNQSTKETETKGSPGHLATVPTYGDNPLSKRGTFNDRVTRTPGRCTEISVDRDLLQG